MIRQILALGLAAALLSACGLQGDLERPVPLWGDPPNEGPLDPRTLKAAEEKAQADKDRKEAERKAADEQRRQQLEQQTAPPTPAPATPPATPPQ